MRKRPKLGKGSRAMSVEDQVRGAKKHVLLADAFASASSLSRELEEAGYVVHVAKSLDEARRIADSIQPQLVVTELVLGDDHHAGLTLLAHLRHAACSPRVAVVTAFASVESAHAVVRAGAVGYLTKPSAMGEILATLGEPTPARPLFSTLEDVRAAYIREIFDYCGSVAETSRALVVDRRSLRRMMTRLGVR